MRISNVKKSDLTRLKEIATSALHESVVESKIVIEKLLKSITSDIDKYFDHDNRVYLTIGDKDLQGYILIKDYWNLAHLFISPEQQSQGLGSHLLKRGISICSENENKTFIRVNSSQNAVKFYKRIGFIDYIPEKPVPDFASPLIYHL